MLSCGLPLSSKPETIRNFFPLPVKTLFTLNGAFSISPSRNLLALFADLSGTYYWTPFATKIKANSFLNLSSYS